MDEEMLQAIREMLGAEMQEIKERLAVVEATVQKTDATIDTAITAFKDKTSLAVLWKILQKKRKADKIDEIDNE